MRKEAVINQHWLDFVNNESRNAYYRMYEHYYAYLLYLGIKRGLNAEYVKDTINDIFLYLWEKRSGLQHVQNPHSYIITFFIRSLYKREPHASQHSINDIFFEEYTPDEFVEPSCDEHLLDSEREKLLLNLVHRQIEQLPPKQRQVIYQKFYLGLSYEEISKTNRISVNTVYNTVYAAMDKLRSLLPKSKIITLVSATATFFAIIFCC
ncbi:MAG: sigma-70 family RNA polymerase sigma factor [Chitinophagaceae bacterium]|nr:sigma-70 family RNA polymerase sigma factor [Chitinophagaceae bacterium]